MKMKMESKVEKHEKSMTIIVDSQLITQVRKKKIDRCPNPIGIRVWKIELAVSVAEPYPKKCTHSNESSYIAKNMLFLRDKSQKSVLGMENSFI